MAIIELNLEKPALKRVESVEENQRRESEADVNPEEVAESMEVDAEIDTDEETESGGKSRVRKYGRRLAVLGGTAAGVAAARKLRQRRKSGSEQQELEEDWQTAE